MYRYPVIFLDEEPLVTYMRENGSGWESKDYELAVVIWLKRALDNSKKKLHCIAFELKEELSQCMPNFNFRNPADIKQTLQKCKREDAYDAFIVEGTADKHEREGWAFQFKRLMGKDVVNPNFLDGLAEYIKGISSKYADTESALVIIPEPNKEVLLLPNDRKKLSVKIGVDLSKNFPFKKVLIMGKTSDDNVSFTEIWPSLFTIETASNFSR